MDLQYENHGTIFLLRPISDAGRNWINEHLPDDATTFGNAIVVEHRYITGIVVGAVKDGLLVEAV